jgi:DNA-binding beta-propeller fold protein YncE
VVDSGNSRVEAFDSSGAFLRQWGGAGSAAGQFETPIGLATDSKGRVYVSEFPPNNRIQVFGKMPPTIGELRESLEALGLRHGIENSLAVKLENAQASLEQGNGEAVCGKLGALESQLRALSGKKLSEEAAAALLEEIGETSASLGCDG